MVDPETRLDDVTLDGIVRALDEDPEDTQAMLALESALEDEQLRSKAAQPLIRLFEQTGQHKKLASAKEALLSVTSERQERRRIFLDLIGIYEEKLRIGPLAFGASLRAMADNPNDEEIKAEVHRLAIAEGLGDELDENALAAQIEMYSHLTAELLALSWLDRNPKTIDGNCPACEEKIQGATWICPTCGSPHHFKCRELLGSCASCSRLDSLSPVEWLKSQSTSQLAGYGCLVVGMLIVLAGLLQMVDIIETNGEHFGAVGTMALAALFLLAGCIIIAAGRKKVDP